LSFREELRFLEKLYKYNCRLQNTKQFKLYSYICRNIVLLAKLDMRSSDNFDDTIHQSHNFLKIIEVRLGQHRSYVNTCLNSFFFSHVHTSNPETLLQYKAASRLLLDAPTSRDGSSVTTSPTSKIYNSNHLKNIETMAAVNLFISNTRSYLKALHL